MAESKIRAVGDAVRSLCTKCKKETRHVVVSVVGGRPAKVQCSQCDGFHNYRDPAAPPAAAKTRSAGAKKTPLRTLEEEWLAQMKGRDPKAAVPYGSVPRPAAGDLVEHPSFGFGVVRKVIPPNRVDIHFRDGIRMLRWEG